jgi:hypothetical protein
MQVILHPLTPSTPLFLVSFKFRHAQASLISVSAMCLFCAQPVDAGEMEDPGSLVAFIIVYHRDSGRGLQALKSIFRPIFSCVCRLLFFFTSLEFQMFMSA